MSIRTDSVGPRMWSAVVEAVQRGYDFASRIATRTTSDYELVPPSIDAVLENVSEGERLPKLNFYGAMIRAGVAPNRAVEMVEKTLTPPSQELKFTKSIHTDKGVRKGQNEDRSFYVDNEEYIITGVCDGHGDPEAKVAQKVSKEFPSILTKHLMTDGNVATKFHNACQEMEDEVIKYQKEKFSSWSSVSQYAGKVEYGEKYTLLLGGCTMTCLLVQKALNRAYVCCLGDSEARLGFQEEIFHASYAQDWGEPDDFGRAREWYMNEATQETIVFTNKEFTPPDWGIFYGNYDRGQNGSCRVRGYNVSRSFGDKGYTVSGELKESQPASTIPIVTEIPLIPGSRVLIASDGYFNFVPDGETSDMLSRNLHADEIAQRALMNQGTRGANYVDRNPALSNEARKYWQTNSGDNITTIAIDVD